MRYPYLTLFEAVAMLLTLFIGIVIIYFLLKIFDKTTKFRTVLKWILLYELAVVIIYAVYPKPIVSPLLFLILKIVLAVLLFFTFYFITGKHFLSDWKKSLALFFLITFIIFPALDYFGTSLQMKAENLPIFAKEISRMENQAQKAIKENGLLLYLFNANRYIPLPMKILGQIEESVFSWPANAIRQTIINKDRLFVKSEPEPYIKVISPNGKESINAGQSFDIKWTSKNIRTVNVSLLSSDDLSFSSTYFTRLCSNVDASFGQCQANLTDFYSGRYYKIRIEGYREKPPEDLTYVVSTDDSDNYFGIGNIALQNDCQRMTLPEERGDCYVQLAVNENDPSICWQVETADLSSNCWEYFGMKEWNIYRNDEYGFEFKYPAICKTSSDSMVGGVQLSVDINSANDNCNFSVVYYDNLDAISIEVNLPRKSVYDFAKDPSLSSTQNIIFNGNDALTGVFENKYISLKQKETYVSHNGHLYEISYTLVNGEQVFKTDIPEKIISTFKFSK